MNIGKRVKDRRKQLGLSADDVAKKLNVNRATIYRYESNYIEKMPTTVLEPLAKVLQTTPAYLMGWEETMEKKNNAIANIVLRLRSDAELLSIVEDLSSLPSDKLQAVKTLISVIKK